MNKTRVGLFLACSIAAGSAYAGDAAQGAQKAAVCGACHGMTGNSVNPEWPSLAGQPEAYVVAQLKAFKDGKRVNPLMTPMAVALSEKDMQDLGAHFAQQTPTGLEADPSNWKVGEKLYRGGDAARGIPACIACHGPAGPRQRPGRIPGTSGPARGLRLQPAQGFQGWNPQLGRQRHHGLRDRPHDRRGNARARLIPTGIAMNKLNVWMLAALVALAGCGKESPPAASSEAEAPAPESTAAAEAPPAAAPAAAARSGQRATARRSKRP